MKIFSVDTRNSKVNFEIRHLMISSVIGNFSRFKGEMSCFDSDEKKADEISFSIDVASIDTHMEQRNKHLLSNDFFAVEDYPTIDFKSSSIKNEADGLEIIGILKIKNREKEIKTIARLCSDIEDKIPKFKISTSIRRSDFELEFKISSKANLVISDIITIEMKIQMIEIK